MRPKWAQRAQRLQFAEWALSFGLSEREKKKTHTQRNTECMNGMQ